MPSVVIPVYNNWAGCHTLLYDIYRNLPDDTEVILVDDCSPDKQVSDGMAWWKNNSMFEGRIRTFRNDKNYGFLRTANFGISKASSELVMLISTDVRVEDSKLVEKCVVELASSSPVLVGAKYYETSTGWNDFGGKIFPYLEGWFLAFRKTTWTKFGLFDELYAPADFEDVDASTKYLAEGGKLVCIDAELTHIGAQSYKYSPEREARTTINKIKFEEKWLN